MTGQNDRQDESLTGQVHDQAGHCPLTGRYFEPWVNVVGLSSRQFQRRIQQKGFTMDTSIQVSSVLY